MVAMMNNTSVPAAIAVMMPIIPANKGDHADALGYRGCEPAADGSAENAGGHIGGEHQSEGERAAGARTLGRRLRSPRWPGTPLPRRGADT
jgi:hypothetical protein